MWCVGDSQCGCVPGQGAADAAQPEEAVCAGPAGTRQEGETHLWLDTFKSGHFVRSTSWWQCATGQCATGGSVPLVAVCHWWQCATGGSVPLVAVCHWWQCATGGSVPLVAVCHWWQCATGQCATGQCATGQCATGQCATGQCATGQ